MVWHKNAGADTCNVGPFTVNASTIPFGASPYSPQLRRSDDARRGAVDSGGVAALWSGRRHQPRAFPPDPAVADPAGAQHRSGSLAHGGHVVQPADPRAQTGRAHDDADDTGNHRAGRLVRPLVGRAGRAGRDLTPRSQSQFGAAASSAVSARRTRVRSTAHKTTTTTTAPADLSLNGTKDVVPFPDVPPANDGRGNGSRKRSSAIDPLSVAAHGTPMAVLLVGSVLIVAAVRFALGLIGRDVRRLIPRRRHRSFGGPIGPPGDGHAQS